MEALQRHVLNSCLSLGSRNRMEALSRDLIGEQSHMTSIHIYIPELFLSPSSSSAGNADKFASKHSKFPTVFPKTQLHPNGVKVVQRALKTCLSCVICRRGRKFRSVSERHYLLKQFKSGSTQTQRYLHNDSPHSWYRNASEWRHKSRAKERKKERGKKR